MVMLALLPVLVAALFSSAIITWLLGGGVGMFIVIFLILKLLGK